MVAKAIWLVAAVSILGPVAGQAGEALSPEKMLALGRHLAQECTSCHRIDGVDNGIPSIVGLAPDFFTETLGFYRYGQRSNPTMVSVAQSLDDEQIKALALYFGSLAKKPSTLEAKNTDAGGQAQR